MRKIYSAVVDFASKVVELGVKAAFEQADAETLRNLKLNRIYNGQRGRGKRSCIVQHRRIEAKHEAHVKRQKAKRWTPPLVSPMAAGGFYEQPHYVARALRRLDRWIRRVETLDYKGMPRHIRETARKADRAVL